jgi:hypothetical protein
MCAAPSVPGKEPDTALATRDDGDRSSTAGDTISRIFGDRCSKIRAGFPELGAISKAWAKIALVANDSQCRRRKCCGREGEMECNATVSAMCGTLHYHPALPVYDHDMDPRRLVRATASARGACWQVHKVWLGGAGAADIRDAQAVRTAPHAGFAPAIHSQAVAGAQAAPSRVAAFF